VASQGVGKLLFALRPALFELLHLAREVKRGRLRGRATVAQNRFPLRINRQDALAAGAGDFKWIPHRYSFYPKAKSR
jgi:hypothetical protein